MNRTTVGMGLVVGLLGAAGGLVVGWPAAIIGLFTGLAAGMAAGRSGVRPFVAVTVAAGTIGGALVGRGVVRALCLPGSCVEVEVVGAIVTGLGALVGVGLVVALVTRSFDEYHDSVAANRPPPQPGCETDEASE